MKTISVFVLVALMVAIASAPAAAKSVAMVLYLQTDGFDTSIQVTYTGEEPESPVVVKAQIVNFDDNLEVKTVDVEEFTYHNQTVGISMSDQDYMPGGMGVVYFFIDTGGEEDANPSADFVVVRAAIWESSTGDCFSSPEIIVSDSEPEETQTLMCQFSDGTSAPLDMFFFCVFPQDLFSGITIRNNNDDAKNSWDALSGHIYSVAYEADDGDVLAESEDEGLGISDGFKVGHFEDLFPGELPARTTSGFLKMTYTPDEETPGGTLYGIHCEKPNGLSWACWQMRREQ
jgi:hypothetical protein